MANSERYKVTPARFIAVWLLNGVTDERMTLAELTGKDKYLELEPADRARALRLATTTLRYAGRADKLLKPHLSKRPPEAIQNMLRLGVVEVLALKAPIHALTNDLVNMAASASRTRPLKGLINAVLRKAVADGEGKWDKSPVPTLPKWLRQPLMAAFGNGPIMLIETAHMKGAPLDVTVKSDPEGWAEKLGGTLLPNGSVRLEGGQVTKMAGYDDGEWWVQDAAATFAATWAGASADQTVLDLCAAPGGKTMQLATTGAAVTAVDLNKHRLERVKQNLERTNLDADVVQADIFALPDDQYDVVLLDAPCSATGTIRRHPDLPFAKDGTGIHELIVLQRKMLKKAASLVKPGGSIVFCTCSLIPDEGEVHIEEFLAKNKDFTVDTALPTGIDPAWVTIEGGVRLRPDYWAEHGGMDGFYLAKLNRADA
ncbi:MAG: RsmB/NOP family class I SAM-dependent RNA methyltransferase [Planktomarina sp.]